MGVTCFALNCAGNYCCGVDNEFQGNIIFKPINSNLIDDESKFSEEEKQILRKCENLLVQSEEERGKIADKFKDLIDNTGAGVLSQPTLERSLIAYIIYLFEQIISCAKAKKVVFDKNDFSLTKFVSITKEKPFISFNQEALDNLKAKYGFDINMIDSLIKGKKSIINFLSSMIDTKTVIEKQYEMVKGLILDFGKNYRLVTKLKDAIEGIKFIFNYFSEITSGILSVENQLSNPRKIDLFYRIAQDAANKGITDPKELVLIYSLGDNCGSTSKWEENVCYKKVEILKF